MQHTGTQESSTIDDMYLISNLLGIMKGSTENIVSFFLANENKAQSNVTIGPSR